MPYRHRRSKSAAKFWAYVFEKLRRITSNYSLVRVPDEKFCAWAPRHYRRKHLIYARAQKKKSVERNPAPVQLVLLMVACVGVLSRPTLTPFETHVYYIDVPDPSQTLRVDAPSDGHITLCQAQEQKKEMDILACWGA